jgi:DNA replicative helicase MCM subunit Mcm2 (Cdc46/Mcm family)
VKIIKKSSTGKHLTATSHRIISTRLLGMAVSSILSAPSEYLPAFEKALVEIATSIYNPTRHVVDPKEDALHIGLCGSFGEQHVDPRGIRASMIGQIICVEGIVTRCEYTVILSTLFLLILVLTQCRLAG